MQAIAMFGLIESVCLGQAESRKNLGRILIVLARLEENLL
jgi:hypothetical protein